MFYPFYPPFQGKGKPTSQPFSILHLNLVLKCLCLCYNDNLLIVIHQVKNMKICYPKIEFVV